MKPLKYDKETFKYHMTLQGREGVKPSECRHMGDEGRPNRHITFTVAEKV